MIRNVRLAIDVHRAGATLRNTASRTGQFSSFQPTAALIDYGRSLSGLLGGKPFVIDTSRNGARNPGGEWRNPAGAGLGEAPTATGDDAVHAFLWVKRPGESDGACGQCAGTPAGQFCTSHALELARNAVF